MSSAASIRSEITAQIIAALSENLIPWRRPWRTSKNSGRPTSVASGKAYTGVNPMLLHLHASRHSFASRWWGTFEQWRKLGFTVMPRPTNVEPGLWGKKIVFYRPFMKTTVDSKTGKEVEEEFRVLRTWTVFNADQVNGRGIERYRVVDEPEAEFTWPDFRPAQELIDGTGAKFEHNGDQAFYRRPLPEDSWPQHHDGDYIVLPQRRRFTKLGGYYETAFHELAHWSEVRLGWDVRQHGYATGELIAEIASCQLAAELHVPDGEDLSNHAKYVKNWLDSMRGDASFVFRAATQATKVTDFLLSFVQQQASDAQPNVIEQAA